MRWLVIPCCAMVAALAFVGWAALTHPGTDPHNGPFEVVARTSATSTVITAQGGQVRPGGQVIIWAIGPKFQTGDGCDSLPCVVKVSSVGSLVSRLRSRMPPARWSQVPAPVADGKRGLQLRA